MNRIIVTMRCTKETKNKWMYEPDPFVQAPVDRVYIDKSTTGPTAPKNITVTVEEV